MAPVPASAALVLGGLKEQVLGSMRRFSCLLEEENGLQDRCNSRSNNNVRTICCCAGHKCCKGKYGDTVVTTLRTSTCDQFYARPAVTKHTERRYGPFDGHLL